MKTWAPSEIQAIYDAYPRHVGRIAAKKAIIAALDRDVSYQKLLQRTIAYAIVVKQDGVKKNYIPYPATWYNRGSYDDDDLADMDTTKERLKSLYAVWCKAMLKKHGTTLNTTDYDVFLTSEGPRLPDDLKPLARQHFARHVAREKSLWVARRREENA